VVLLFWQNVAEVLPFWHYCWCVVAVLAILLLCSRSWGNRYCMAAAKSGTMGRAFSHSSLWVLMMLPHFLPHFLLLHPTHDASIFRVNSGPADMQTTVAVQTTVACVVARCNFQIYAHVQIYGDWSCGERNLGDQRGQ
jgi:hypothetical protein